MTWTTFTEWQRHFHWDSVIAAAQLHDTEGDAADRKLDTDGMLAAELQNTIYEGDPEDQGVVWPHIAEIGLLGGLGCGRWLAEAAIEEVSLSFGNTVDTFRLVSDRFCVVPAHFTCSAHLNSP